MADAWTVVLALHFRPDTMRPSHDVPEAPTYLRAGDIPPGLFDDQDAPTRAIRTASLPHGALSPRGLRDEPAPLPGIAPAREHAPDVLARGGRVRSASPAPRVQVPAEPASAPPRQRLRSTPSTGAPRPQAAAPDHSSIFPPQRASAPSGPSAVVTPSPAVAPPPAREPAITPPPAPRAPTAAPAAAQVSSGEVGAIDPLAVATPPELAGAIYGHIRRLALQAELAGADRVLRDALAELTSSLSCAIVYPGEDGLWTLGDDDEIPRDPQRLVAVATARRAVIGSHVAIIPVVTTTETVAVITLTRNARQPGFQPIEHVAMVALAREAAPILHHLAVQHLQRKSELQADKGSLYRGEALEAHRTRGQEGELVQLAPTWVKRAYPILVVALLAALGFAIFIRVPTYSTGTAVVMFEGSTSVTATASGTVETVFVRENQPVKQGDPLIQLNSPDEAAQLASSEAEWRDTQVQFLFEQADEQIRKTLAQAATSRDHALARLAARTLRAPRDGVVTNLHVQPGAALQLGSYVLQITDENSEIEVLGFLPSRDSPRIRPRMALQLELDGYTKARVIGTITHVQSDAVSPGEAAKLGGDLLAESIAKELTAGTWTTLRARLPSRTFKTEHSTYHYHHGMHAKVEVKIQSKPFLATLLPAIEKYLPD